MGVQIKETDMKNYITKYEYTGANAATLAASGSDEVMTFKQALTIEGMSGKKMKGIKKCATLVRFSKKDKVIDENGVEKPKPIFFSVFDAQDVLKRLA